MSRQGALVEGGVVTNLLMLADGAKGDEAVEFYGLIEVGEVMPSIGWSWDGEQFAPPSPPPKTWDDIRAERDRLLAASDWTQVADAPVDAAPWAVYRQQLRDIPQDFATPDDVVWPEQP